MNFRFSRMLAGLAAVALPLAFGACSLFEPGLPAASVTLKARSAFEVKATLESVFGEEGYHLGTRTNDLLTFERDGGKVDTTMYGNWLGSQVSERVRVIVAERGEGQFRLRAMPSVVENSGDYNFEDDHRRLELYSFHLAHLLNETKRRLK